MTNIHALTELIAIVPVNASSTKDTTILYTIPSGGRLVVRIVNPDTSADGMFTITVADNTSGACVAFNEFFTTGIVPWGSRFYHSNPTIGLYQTEYEMSLTSRTYPTPPPPGRTVRIRIVYPGYDLLFGTEHTGIDTLFLYFNDTPLYMDTTGAIFLDSLVTGPFDSSYRNYSFATECGTKLIARVTRWGNAGGGDSYYIDGLGCGGTYTGSPCACEFYSFHIPNGPGTHTLIIAHEDDYWGDNTDYRAVMIYLVPLEPEIDSVWFNEETECNDSNIVSICYSLSNCQSTIFIYGSSDSGRSWDAPINTITDTSGDLGENISPGIHCFNWLMHHDLPAFETRGFFIKVVAIDTSFVLGDTNLIQNPGLETPFNSSTDWSTRGAVTRSSSRYHSGSYSFYVNTDCWAQYIYQSWPLLENQSYFFECFILFESSTYRAMTLEIVRDWDPATGYALVSSAISFFTPDSISFTVWGGRNITISALRLTTGEWHRVGIFADVTHRRQTVYIDGRPISFIETDTSYTPQYIIAGAVSGSCNNFGRLYFDDFFLTYINISPYEHSSTGRAPVDSRPPALTVDCPSPIVGGETATFRISIDDIFYTANPVLFHIFGGGIDEIHSFTGTSFTWRAPRVDIPSCTVAVSVRDSFCNWGYDTCITTVISAPPVISFNIEKDSLICMPNGRFYPNPMSVRVILTNTGIRVADSVVVGLSGLSDECFRIISGRNPSTVYDLLPGEVDTVEWRLEIDESCEARTECITSHIISYP